MVLRRLRPLQDIMDDYPEDFWRADGYEHLMSVDGRWCINDDMSEKFGDGLYYSFKEMDEYEDYTHVCFDDNFYYHYSWFESEEVFGDKDFEI